MEKRQRKRGKFANAIEPGDQERAQGEDHQKLCQLARLKVNRPKLDPALRASAGFSLHQHENEQDQIDKVKPRSVSPPDSRIDKKENRKRNNADQHANELLLEIVVRASHVHAE